MTVISKSTVEVLKNFCSINKSIVIKPGNQSLLLASTRTFLLSLKSKSQFDSQISIYDLGVFLGGLSLFDSPKIDTTESNYVTVSDTERGRFKTRFFYADVDIILNLQRNQITLPSEDVNSSLSLKCFVKSSIVHNSYQSKRSLSVWSRR